MSDIYDPLSNAIIGTAIYVHGKLAPGLLESTYEECLGWALARRGFGVQRQCMLPIVFDGYRVRDAYRIDLLIDRQLIVEVKSVERILPVHEAQLRTYLRMSGHTTGLLFNFNTVRLKDGIRRITL